MKKLLFTFLLTLMMISLVGCGGGNNNATSPTEGETKENTEAETQKEEPKADKPVFKIGAIPDQNVSDLNRRFDELAKYISELTGLEVEYVPSQDYAALVTAFKRGEVHLGWFGGLTGVQARNAVEGAEAIAQRPSDENFHSVFIAQKNLDVKKLEDLKGKSFTFGSESSTSGHLMPRHFLLEAGVNPEEDFDGQPNYSGSHDKTWKLVEAGSFQAGALNENVWKSAVEEEKVDLNKVKAFYTTPAYYDYNWTINNVNETFGKGTKEKVKEALLSMSSEQNDILELFHTDKFIETNNENYKAIEDVAKQIGIIK